MEGPFTAKGKAYWKQTQMTFYGRMLIRYQADTALSKFSADELFIFPSQTANTVLDLLRQEDKNVKNHPWVQALYADKTGYFSNLKSVHKIDFLDILLRGIRSIRQILTIESWNGLAPIPKLTAISSTRGHLFTALNILCPYDNQLFSGLTDPCARVMASIAISCELVAAITVEGYLDGNALTLTRHHGREALALILAFFDTFFWVLEQGDSLKEPKQIHLYWAKQIPYIGLLWLDI